LGWGSGADGVRGVPEGERRGGEQQQRARGHGRADAGPRAGGGGVPGPVEGQGPVQGCGARGARWRGARGWSPQLPMSPGLGREFYASRRASWGRSARLQISGRQIFSSLALATGSLAAGGALARLRALRGRFFCFETDGLARFTFFPGVRGRRARRLVLWTSFGEWLGKVSVV
jgi:hypothetical protein